MNLKGSKTEKNLMEAFAGESQARNKYTYYASKAKKEGYEQIAAFFLETADNEKEHAKIWFKLLHDGIGSTRDNLKDAAAGENGEWTEMYARMAKEAKEIGADEILMAKNIDYIYTDDPRKNPDAKKLETVKASEVLAMNLKAIDATATAFALANGIPIKAFGLKNPDDIIKAVRGECVGTVIIPE